MNRVQPENGGFKRRDDPQLKELVGEASQALACLDTMRLEELAQCCQTINREMTPANSAVRADHARQAGEAAEELAVFARVMEATRANLNVMKRLRELCCGRLEYSGEQIRQWPSSESGNGNH
jgi:hypothetical protein